MSIYFRKWWKSHEIQSKWCLNVSANTVLWNVCHVLFPQGSITATLFLGLFNSQGTGLNLLHLPKLTKLLAKELKMFQHFTATQFHCSLLNRFVSHTSLPKSSETNGRSRSIAVQYLACLKRGRLALSSILSQSGAERSWSAKFVGLRALPAKGLKHVVKGFQQFASICKLNEISPKGTSILTGRVELQNAAPVWSDLKVSLFRPSPSPSIFRSMLLQRPRDHWAPCWSTGKRWKKYENRRFMMLRTSP